MKNLLVFPVVYYNHDLQKSSWEEKEKLEGYNLKNIIENVSSNIIKLKFFLNIELGFKYLIQQDIYLIQQDILIRLLEELEEQIREAKHFIIFYYN